MSTIETPTQASRTFHIIYQYDSEEHLERILSRIYEYLQPMSRYFLVARHDSSTYQSGIIKGSHLHIMLCTYYTYMRRTIFGKTRLQKGDKIVIKVKPPQQRFEVLRNYIKDTERGKLVLKEEGDCPKDKDQIAQENKKRKTDKYAELVRLAKAQKWTQLEEEFPQDYIIYGARLKGLFWSQKLQPKDYRHEDHLWIYGEPGTGKSAIVNALYPNCYHKRGDEDWLGFDPMNHDGHEVVYINDLGPTGMLKLTPELIKSMCDPQGFNINKKFAGGDRIVIQKVIITSNYTINECIDMINPKIPGSFELKRALNRRFKSVYIKQFLDEQGLKLKSKDALSKLKKEHNNNSMLCFTELLSGETNYLPTTTSSRKFPTGLQVLEEEVIDLTDVETLEEEEKKQDNTIDLTKD